MPFHLVCVFSLELYVVQLDSSQNYNHLSVFMTLGLQVVCTSSASCTPSNVIDIVVARLIDGCLAWCVCDVKEL